MRFRRDGGCFAFLLPRLSAFADRPKAMKRNVRLPRRIVNDLALPLVSPLGKLQWEERNMRSGGRQDVR